MTTNIPQPIFAAALWATMALTVAASAIAAPPPTKWKIIRTDGGACQYSVPADWKQEPRRPWVSESPAQDVVVSPQKVGAKDSFDDVKKQLQDKLPPLKVLKDTADRYWYVYRDPADAEDSPDTHWMVAVAGDHVCAAQVTFKSAEGESLPTQIVATIKHSE